MEDFDIGDKEKEKLQPAEEAKPMGFVESQVEPKQFLDNFKR